MTFLKGYIQTEEQQKKMRNTRVSKNGSTNCLVCNEIFPLYNKNNKICSKRKCYESYRIIKYKMLGEKDQLEFKRFKLFSTIRLGKGKKEISLELLKNALNTNCVYCRCILNIENISVDHKIPRTGSLVYNRKKKTQIYSDQEIRELDKKENLQIICKKCNNLKGDFSDEEYKILLNFLKDKEIIKDKLFKRLRQGFLFFKYKT